MRTKLFIDVEFNSFQGELMSMGIVSECGEVFYHVLPLPENIHPWVQENVVPVLIHEPESRALFEAKLHKFLGQFKEGFHLIADWPEDIKHFMDALIIGPGERLSCPPFICEVRRDIHSGDSAVPHNALEDAVAIKRCYFKLPFKDRENV